MTIFDNIGGKCTKQWAPIHVQTTLAPDQETHSPASLKRRLYVNKISKPNSVAVFKEKQIMTYFNISP